VTSRLRSSVRFIPSRPVILAGALLLAGCSWLAPPPVLRGNKVAADQLKELVPGTSTRADVTALIGSPTAHATFDDNTWLYISELTQIRIGRTLGELDQHVVVVTFNDQGVLQDIQNLTKADELPVTMEARTTPSPGTEANFLQQLLGNIGKFNAAGATPGSAGSGSGSGGAPRPSQ
jgi:outer membrane protein assembly factor BamE (lipoprotein component of BamABCDE complex)